MSSTTNLTGAHTVSDTDTSYPATDLERGTNDRVDTGKETKPGYKTTEFAVWLLASLIILIAAAVVDRGDANAEGAFSALRGFQLFTWVTVAYIISRGLAKIGVRHHDH
jgi:hypothetical protein